MSVARRFEGAFAVWMEAVVRLRWPVLIAGALLSAVSAWYAATHLGVNTDTADMISPDLEWRVRYRDYKASFPGLQSLLTVVVEARGRDAALSASRRLSKALLTDASGMFSQALDIEDLPYFRRHGLLYLDAAEFDALGARLVAAQPLLGYLSVRPDAPRLIGLLARMRTGSTTLDGADPDAFLAAIANAAAAASEGRSERIQWRALLDPRGAEVPSDVPSRRFLQVSVALDYSELLPAGPAMARIRTLAREIGLEQVEGARVRITGGTAMAHEELDSVSRGMGVAGLSALVLVVIALSIGLGSWRLALATLGVLIAGLLWTAAYAALTVGALNLISVAFAVLYIGLGADYATHYLLRYRELVREGWESHGALVQAGRDVGVSLSLCALTTCVGFLAFVPTDFDGVSELGIISSGGMVISLVASLTLLPALVVVLGVDRFERAPAVAVTASRGGVRGARITLALFVGALLGSALLLPQVRFDHNPLNLRDPKTESVATYLDLMRSGTTAPWTLSLLSAPDQVPERMLALERVPEVDSARSIASFLPTGQESRLAALDDLNLVLGPDFGAGLVAGREAASVDALINALKRYFDATSGLPADAAWSALDAGLEQLAATLGTGAGRRAADAFHDAVFVNLASQIADLRTALDADFVTLESLPDALRERWVAADGRWRVQARPVEDLSDNDALERFVSAVHAVAPDATGTPEVNLGAGQVVTSAFVQALVSALVLVAVLLALLTGSVRDSALVLLPLMCAGVFTCALMILAGLSFNFANVICLPLLLGIGVDNGIHIVHRVRSGGGMPESLLRTSTARAVLLSALTTFFSFGSLAWSSHPGTASMGLVLSIGLAMMVITTLALLPAVLRLQEARG